MYLFFRKIGASWVRRSRICPRPFQLLLGRLGRPRPSRRLTWANSSFSKLSRNSRTRARATGSPASAGVREALVDVLVDDVRLVQGSGRAQRGWHLVVRVHQGDVFGLGEQVDVADLEVHALLEQHEAAAVRIGVRWFQVKNTIMAGGLLLGVSQSAMQPAQGGGCRKKKRSGCPAGALPLRGSPAAGLGGQKILHVPSRRRRSSARQTRSGPRKISTHHAKRTRALVGPARPIHCMKATRSPTASSYWPGVNWPGLILLEETGKDMRGLAVVVRVGLLLFELGAARWPATPTAHAASPTLGKARLFQPVPWTRRGRRSACRCRGSPHQSPWRHRRARRAIRVRSGGVAPNQSLACFGSMAIFICSPTLSVVKIRLFLICLGQTDVASGGCSA